MKNRGSFRILLDLLAPSMNRLPHFAVFQASLAAAISLIALTGSEMRGEVDRMPDPEKFWVFQAIERPKTPKVRNDSGVETMSIVSCFRS